MLSQAIAAIALGLLAVAGFAKLLNPVPTARALNSAGVVSGQLLPRALGFAEILAAAVGLVLGGLLLLPAAALYLGFTLFTIYSVLGTETVESCGCFGTDDAPPSYLHLVFNLVALVAIGWLAVTGTTVIPWEGSVLVSLAYLALAALGTYASYLLLAVMPRTLTLADGR